jgi:ligand-binding sensor domain-containing protein
LTLWIDGGVFVFGWQAGQWKSFGPDNTDGKLPSTVNSIARDAYGHIWFAHEKGLTVLARGNEIVDLRSTDWQTCDFSGTPMLPGVIWSVATSDAGHVLWFTGENGLGRVELTDDLSLANCRSWSLATWPKTPDLADFWNGETRLALDETPAGLSVWIIKRNQKRAYHVDWQ